MYNYINVKEIKDLAWKNRQGIVITNIDVESIDEYINNILIYLKNNGFDLNLLNQPRILGDKKHGYTLVLLIKKNKLIDMQSSSAWSKLLISQEQGIDKMTLQDFAKDMKNISRKNRNIVNVSTSNEMPKTVKCFFKKSSDGHSVKGVIKLVNTGGHIVKSIVKLENIGNYVEDVLDCHDNLNKILAKSVTYAFKNYNLILVSVVVSNKLNFKKYNVEITDTSIELKLQ